MRRVKFCRSTPLVEIVRSFGSPVSDGGSGEKSD
jgi:hypothetical protein